MNDPIRAFVSYSGDDWKSFVEPFATELRRNGIDAVAADWDIHGGQSLVRRILEEELPLAQAVIIVLSQTSVTKPWVREELDHATVMRINGQIKLIPVKIDDCTVPLPLQTLKRITIHHPGEREEKIRQVIDSIYGYSRRPPLGQPPSYALIPSPAGFSQLEWSVLAHLGEIAWDLKGDWLEMDRIHGDDHGLGLTETQITKTLERLQARRLVEGQQYITGSRRFGSLRLTVRGAGEYCRHRSPNFNHEKRRIAAYLASFDPDAQLELDPPEELAPLVFRVAIDELAAAGLIQVLWIPGGNRVIVTKRSPLLDDWIDQN